MPMIIASAVISTGRRRVRPAASAASSAVVAVLVAAVVGERDHQDEFAVATPTAMIAPIRLGTLNVVCVDEERQHDADARPGQRGDDDERVGPALEVHDHQQVDEHRGEHDARGPGCGTRCVMLSTCPRTAIVAPGGSFARSSATICSSALATEPRSVPCTSARTLNVGWMLLWFATTGVGPALDRGGVAEQQLACRRRPAG